MILLVTSLTKKKTSNLQLNFSYICVTFFYEYKKSISYLFSIHLLFVCLFLIFCFDCLLIIHILNV